MKASHGSLLAALTLCVGAFGTVVPVNAMQTAKCTKVAPASHDAYARCVALSRGAAASPKIRCANLAPATHDAYARCLAVATWPQFSGSK